MSLSTVEFDFIRTLVQDQSAIVLRPEKEYLVKSRLEPLAKSEGYLNLEEMVATLRKNNAAALRMKVVEAMTTNETYFFRDVAPFEHLRKTILPELILKRKESRRLDIWCVACSTGQEPYSIAMLIRENFPQLATWDIRFLATDLSQEVLEKARTGSYSQLEVNRGLPVAYLMKYFERRGVQWRLKESIWKMVKFQEMNLIRPWPNLQRMDIMMVRNVMIYFDRTTKQQILRKTGDLLARDGYLFLGGAETTIHIDNRFERMPLECGGVYRLVS